MQQHRRTKQEVNVPSLLLREPMILTKYAQAIFCSDSRVDRTGALRYWMLMSRRITYLRLSLSSDPSDLSEKIGRSDRIRHNMEGDNSSRGTAGIV